jgi:DNA helicase HerA-like ATPase
VAGQETRLGTVQDVQGSSVSVALDRETIAGLAFVAGHGYRIGQIGSLIRIPMGFTDLFGVVSQVGAGAVPDRLADVEPYGYRWMAAQLVGEGGRDHRFVRGVSQYPTVGDEVFLVTEDDLGRIYGRKEAPGFVKVGQLATAESIPALVAIDTLVTRHSAIVGATGSGKSTTVASLLATLVRSNVFPSARVIVLDIHGEYGSTLRDHATIFRVNPRDGEQALHIPYWAMTFDELVRMTFGDLQDADRGGVLETITDLKLKSISQMTRAGVTPESLTVDTPVPFSIHELWFELHRLVHATHTVAGGQTPLTEALLPDSEGGVAQPGDAMRVIPPRYQPQTQAAGQPKIYLSSSRLNIGRPLERLASRLRDPRFDFLFRPGDWGPASPASQPVADLDQLLEDWVGGPNPITILDLSGVPGAILTELVGALIRILFDALFWARELSEGGRERPLLIVLEEAHSYLARGEHPAAQAVGRVVKEGRKYGIGAMIVSQRPSEIDATVLSQCGTIFALRLTNAADRSHVTGAVTDNLTGLLSMLPVLRTGEAVIVGEAVRLPLRALIESPPAFRRPDSGDPLVYDASGPGGWNRQREPSKYDEVVEVWRRQDPRSPSILHEEQ